MSAHVKSPNRQLFPESTATNHRLIQQNQDATRSVNLLNSTEITVDQIADDTSVSSENDYYCNVLPHPRNPDFSRACCATTCLTTVVAVKFIGSIPTDPVSFYFITFISSLSLTCESLSILQSESSECRNRAYDFGCGMMVFPFVASAITDGIYSSLNSNH